MEIHSEENTLKTTEDKVERYKEMLGESKAIFVLSVGAKKTETGGLVNLRPDSYTSLDNHNLMGGGHANTIAAAEIGQHFPDIKLVTTSAPENGAESLAKTYAEEIERLGINGQQIELEELSTNTLTELIEMVKKAKANNWNDIAILSSETHKRVPVMLEHLGELAKDLKDNDFTEAWKYFKNGKKLKVRILQTEEILQLRSPKYIKIIEDLRKTEQYKARIEAEEMGVRQVLDGTYGKQATP